MKRLNYLFCALLLFFGIVSPGPVLAEEMLSQSLVIHEIQTNGAGSGTTLQEFIELTSVATSDTVVSGWQIRYTSSSGVETVLYTFPEQVSVAPAEKILLVPINTPADFLTTISPKLLYSPPTSSGIAASGGTVAVFTNLGIKIDSVSWASTAAAATGDIVQYSGGGKSIQRKNVAGVIAVTGNNKNDFEVLDVPTPEVGVIEIVEPPLEENEEPVDPTPLPDDSPPTEPTQNEPPSTDDPTETPVPPTESAIKAYLPILVNELYIDPITPETDANNEWVELYNPNSQDIEVTGYVVASGATYSYKYTFSDTTIVPANSYIVISSANTSIALSNGGGAVKVSDPTGVVLDSTTYTDAPAGQAWAKNSAGQWEWTTTPTNLAFNIITAPLPPVIKTAAVKASKVKKATTAKKTTVKAATTKAVKAKTVKASTFDEPALIAAPTPIPGWLLAVLVSLALLYVGYEYRFEARNTLYKLRNYRNSRR